MRNLLFVLPLLFVIGCTSLTTPAGVSEEQNASSEGLGSLAMDIVNYAYTQNPLVVRAGDTVTWTNQDSVAHTVTSITGVFDSGLFGKGQSFSFTFSEAGEFEYYCTLHPYMKGTIIVVA
ncbi:hypothetical protein COT72_01985 [archaeon CG10_big_fil_rev_8_21_14_0_10_43_11]|nr:MAG: hypothetical protein COT72_01985 [archaeon CG10_big_fil_rev_8_21_14_0_10_43_11]